MPKRWHIAAYDNQRTSDLQRAAQIPTVVAQLLLARGIDNPATAREFLEAKFSGLRDPSELPHTTTAAELILKAIRDQQKITIYGDYDADGMTSTAILWKCLRMLGADVDFYVPHRIDEGYGLNSSALRKLAQQGTRLIVTVDCGIASVAEADVAAEVGLTLIITDHHQMASSLPQAAALVHPNLPDTTYPFPELCGAGVALKLAWALCQQADQQQRVSPKYKSFLMQAVGLAAIGTVADVVPLIDENRILVRHGLNCLSTHPTVGVAALIQQAGLGKKKQLAGDDIGFSLAPRLNAAGRMGQALLGIELLTTENRDRAQQLAIYIDDLNEQRKTLERSIQLAATKQVKERPDFADASALVLAHHQWHPGVIGIVAGRLAEKYHRPVVLVATDPLGVRPGIGSARSIPGFNLHSAFASCDQYLVSHGGHQAAAGLKIEESRLDAFREAFCALATEQISAEQREAQLHIDAETTLQSLTHQTVRQIESLAPFGNGNTRPVLCANNVRLAGPPRRIGNGGRHLSMTFDEHGVKMRAVAFGGGDWEEELSQAGEQLSIAFQPVINNWRGRSSVEIHLADWRAE
ncbi:MAG: single-stranded-DNA-specific exonuclease RecJ [Pirellulales bacterium]